MTLTSMIRARLVGGPRDGETVMLAAVRTHLQFPVKRRLPAEGAYGGYDQRTEVDTITYVMVKYDVFYFEPLCKAMFE
jgi:hypothetical protein